MINNINFEVVKNIVVAGPGYTKNEFMDYLKDETTEKNHYPELHNRKEMFIVEHASSGYKHSLKEILLNKGIQVKIQASSAISEAKALEEFYEMLRKDPDRAAYGKKWVFTAAKENAIGILLMYVFLLSN